MTRIKSFTLLAILCLAATPSRAMEELSGDALIVQAKIPKLSNWLDLGFDSVWSTTGTKLLRVNTADNSFVEIDIKGSGSFHSMGVGEGAVWIPDLDRSAILKVDPITNKVVLELPAVMLYQDGNIGVGAGSVWAVTGALQKTLTRYNPASGSVEAQIPLPSVSSYVVVDFGSVWVTGPGGNEMYRIDPKTDAIVSTTKLHKSPKYMCSGEGSLWVLNLDGLVDRIDGESGKVLATIDTELRSGHGGDLACGGGYVWAKMSDFTDAASAIVPGAAAVQIDPKTNTALRRFGVAKGFGPDIRWGAGSLWISGASLYRIETPK